MLTLSALSPVASVYIGGAGVLHLAGTGAALGYVLGGLVSALVSLLCAELGGSFPRAGGLYPGLVATVGGCLGFGYVALSLLAAPLFMAFASYGFASYVRVLIPALPHSAIVAGVLVLATGIAVLKIRTSALVTGLFLAIEAVALIVLAGVAALHPVRSLAEVVFHPVMLIQGALRPTPPVTMAMAVVAGVWSTAGATWAMFFGEDMRNAQRRIGSVVAWAGLIAAILIAAPVALVVLAAPDLKAMLAAEAPIAAFLNQTSGPLVAGIVSAGVLAAIFNNLVAASMGLSRFLFSTGRDALWSGGVNRWLSSISPTFGSPLNAALALAVVAYLCSLMGERALITLLAGDVSYVILTALAILVGRRAGTTGQFYRAPAHPVLPAFALLVAAASVVANLYDPEAGRPSTFILSGVFAAACAYYALGLRRRTGGFTSYVPPAPAEEAA